jgi:hypothetical protein
MLQAMKRVRIVFADELPDCECCEDKWCLEHKMHYADCPCVGPTNAEELGYKLVEDGDGVLWGVQASMIDRRTSS